MSEPTQWIEQIESLSAVGTALASEKDLDRLLELVLQKSRELLKAEAGSLFLAEGPSPDRPSGLRFKLAQNDRIRLDLTEFLIPLNPNSLAGYVATHRQNLRFDDVYNIPENLPFSFYSEIDHKTGYRSKSILSVPMVDHRNHLIGVVQLWNKLDAAKQIMSFSDFDERLLTSLASQAGVAIENARLYDEINFLFKSFIRASVSAIEARDPTTSGHSERVAKLTVGLAKKVQMVRFSADELREMEYAALLHDFGKIGVREAVLVKAKKLYPMELDVAELKLELLECQLKLRKYEDVLRKKTSSKVQKLDFAVEEQKVAHLRSILRQSNEPTVLPEAISKELDLLRGISINLHDLTHSPLLSDEQIVRLSIEKGSLSEAERQEIESHVTHTYKYLRAIPWTRDFKNLASIAHAHHEKLDGSGYPRKLKGDDIPIQSKIMAVVDIYDALTARDRPYKKAVPTLKALEILNAEAKAEKLDSSLVSLFIEEKVYEATLTE